MRLTLPKDLTCNSHFSWTTKNSIQPNIALLLYSLKLSDKATAEKDFW